MEKADNNAKTDLYRNLKVLSAELKAIDASAWQLLEGTKIARQQDLSTMDKAGKMVKSALNSAVANAVLAVKKVQAAPTPATFNELFAISDPPGRKLQVQLLAAKNQIAAGKLKSAEKVDPGFIADKLAPWQSQNAANNNLPSTATKQEVTARLEQFKSLLKYTVEYSQQL